MKGRRTCKERVLAFTLAFALALTGILPGSGLAAKAAENDISVNVNITDVAGPLSGVALTFKPGDNSGDVVAKNSEGGSYTCQLDSSKIYSYTATLNGYDVKTGDNYKPGNPLDIVMKVAKFEIEGGSEVTVDNTLALSTNSPFNGSIDWESLDDSKALVSPDGIVTGKSSGTVNITASYHGEIATKSITVNKRDPSLSVNL